MNQSSYSATLSQSTKFDQSAILAAKAMNRLARIEIAICGQLLASVSPSRQAAMARAHETRLSADDFSQEDCRAIFIGWKVAVVTGEKATATVLRFCRRSLQHVGAWEEREASGNLTSSRWSDAKLAAIATKWPYENSTLCGLIAELRAAQPRPREAA